MVTSRLREDTERHGFFYKTMLKGINKQDEGVMVNH